LIDNPRRQIMTLDELIKAQQRAGLLPEQFEVLESYVPGSRLHSIINNPHDEGIDEG